MCDAPVEEFERENSRVVLSRGESRLSKLACVHTSAESQAWARTGECERHPGLMRERCCNACSDIDRFGKDTGPAEADPAACEVRVKQGQCISNPRAIADECCRSCLDWQDGTMHCADTAPTQCGPVGC